MIIRGSIKGLAALSKDYYIQTACQTSLMRYKQRTMNDVNLPETFQEIINMVTSLMACPHGFVTLTRCLIS